MSNILLITDLNSPLAFDIKKSSIDSYIVGEAIPNFSDYTTIFDFTTLGKIEKQALLNELKHDCMVYCDLTCFDSQFFYEKYPNLKGSFSSLLLTDTRKIEFHVLLPDENIDSVLDSINLKPIYITESGIGFIYARTLAQIVNEAYFALEETVASENDIDRAMKFGVNYPHGPITWVYKKERFIVTILEELKEKFPGNRYNVANLLNQRSEEI